MDLATRQVFYNLSTRLGIKDPNWLIDLVNFESGINPTAKNPFSSARGLIQFINSTARSLGYESSLDLVNKNPTVIGQLEGPVYEYLKQFDPYPTETSLYLSVFFPAARRYDPNTKFSKIFQDIYGSNWESKYQTFEKANGSIRTPQDYIDYVKKKPIIRVAVRSGIGILGLALLYLLYKRYIT